MTTYVILGSWTDQGVRAIKDLPRRLDATKAALKEMGGEVKSFHMTMGDHDFVVMAEAPDDAVCARFVLTLGAMGFVRTKTLKAFPEAAFREIVKTLGRAAGIGFAATRAPTGARACGHTCPPCSDRWNAISRIEPN